MQDDTLSGEVTSVDISTKENLENLVKCGEELLKKPVSRVNLETGEFEPVDQGTNEEALIRYTLYIHTSLLKIFIYLNDDILYPYGVIKILKISIYNPYGSNLKFGVTFASDHLQIS